MLEYTLLDDGTMDTVVECFCPKCERIWEERFMDASDYRDPDTGAMIDLDGLMAEFDIYCDCDAEEYREAHNEYLEG